MWNPLSVFNFLFGYNDSSHTEAPTGVSTGNTIAIVGGGVIGLSTAYNLALENKKSKPQMKQRIVVLEAGPSVFSSASSHNTGCLHYYFPEEFGKDLTPLGKYSFAMWNAIAQESSTFINDTGYRPDSLLPIVPGSGRDQTALPNWIKNEQQWNVNWGSRGNPCATVNPLGIAKWLERECIQMGVEIKTGATVLAVRLNKGNVLEGLECSLEGRDGDYFLPCQKMVLAVGPWTPALLESLFPNTSIDLKPAINAGDWLVMENKNCLNANSLAVAFFDDIVHEKLEFAGRNDGTIWVCGRRNYTASLPPPNKKDKPDEAVISDLIKFSRWFVKTELDEGRGVDHDPIILSQGRSFRPSTISGLPIISKLPSIPLFNTEEPHYSTDSGVFVCYGHGSYGITLGIGSGKLISQLVRNERTDIDISKFGLAQD